MILTIAGTPGSGKDTVAKILSEELDLQLISLGNLRREAAKQKNMTLEEFNKWSLDNSEEGDSYFDDYQKDFGRKNNNFIMVSRLGWYFIPHSIKIFVDVDEKVGAERIFNEKNVDNSRNELISKDVDEQVKLNKQRINNDIRRYSLLYGINPYEKTNYNLIIDSTSKTPREIVDIVKSRL